MKQTWRWFGPGDQISISEIRQADAEAVVSALHHIPTGEVWSPAEILRRKNEVSLTASGESTGLAWEVVESLPVSEQIKRQDGLWRDHIEAYKKSLRNLADADIRVVCYNFMPVLDWTRTQLYWPLENGATCMRFDAIDFAAFDLYILKRAGASDNYSSVITEKAREQFGSWSDSQKLEITKNVACGLPGAAEELSLDKITEQLQLYAPFDHDRLRRNLYDFLEQVAPVAQQLGIRLCCHPDDPPFDLLGLPRIMSTEADYLAMIKAIDIPANGITFCTGSLGARADNDLPGMVRRLGSYMHFLHLRNVKRETWKPTGSFHESRHLDGDVDMVAVIDAILKEENHRKSNGRRDWSIPMRPDHGHDILDDKSRKAQPGYPAIGRLKGLAELRGVMSALQNKQGALEI